MAKLKLHDLLRGATGGLGEPSTAPVDPVAPGSPPPAVAETAPVTPKAAAGGVAIRPRRPPSPEEIRAQTKRLMVRKFVRDFLAMGEPTFMNAAECYRRINPDCTSNTQAHQEGWRLTQDQDVRDEYAKQLRAIDKAADLDDQWVYDRWRAIAEADIFDYCQIDADGVVHFDNLNPAKLTKEQRFAIQEIQIDLKTGRIKNLKLASKNTAVANVARARQMIDGKRDASMVDLAQRITERMNRAAARVGRVIDHDTGEQV